MAAKYELPIPPGVEIVDVLEEGRAYVIKRMPRRADLAQWSAEVSGFVYCADHTFTHAAGAHSEVYIVEAIKNPITGERELLLPKLLAAREVTQKLTGIKNVGYTYSQMARTISAWLNIYQMPSQNFKQLIPTWHYQSFIPGVYDHATMWDMTAAYWQVVQRVDSPRVRFVDGRVEFQPIAVEQRKRWNRLLNIFSDPRAHKQLRLTLVGVNAAGWRDPAETGVRTTVCFHKGVEQKPKNLSGALQPLALLAVRCTYELTQVQSEISRAVYSNADAVVTTFDGEPDYWQSLGVIYRQKAAGASIIRRMGSYLIGDTMTALYPHDAQFKVMMKQQRPVRIEDPYIHASLFTGSYKGFKWAK